MAKLEEIIKTEMSRSDSRTFSRIHLFREGSFLRAYEQSAWLMSRYAAAELNPKRHKTKQTADGTFVFVGFPLTSLDKYRPVNSQDVPSDESHIILDLPADTFPEEVTKELYDADFERWKKEIALTDNKNSANLGPPAQSCTQFTSTIGGSEVDVNWVQLWAGGPKFAEFNVGAANNKAEDYGGYYAWGGSQDKVDDHNMGTVDLKDEADTATNLWGSEWRMPTKAELDGLLANCDVAWTTVNGVNGRKFTGKGGYASNSVFLPAAGFCDYGNVRGQGDYGYYWSSTPDDSSDAHVLYFNSGYQLVDYYDRYYGYSVRAVLAE